MHLRSIFLVRLLLLLGATAGVAGLVVLMGHRSASPLVGNLSAIAWLAGVLLLAIVIGFLTAATVPTQRLRDVARWFDDRLSAPIDSQGIRSGAAMILATVAACAFLLCMVRFVPLNNRAKADQVEYLRLAAQIRGDGGVARLYARLLSGRFREANRHPLFPAVLATVPESPTPDATFARAKWVTAVLGLLVFTTLIWAVRRYFCVSAACVFAALLSTSFSFLRSNSLVACEGLLILWTALLWLTARGAGQERSKRRFWCLFAMGALAGLGYLTKGSALLLAATLVAWLLLPTHLVEDTSNRTTAASAGPPFVTRLLYAGLFVIGFFVIAAPLLVRNMRVYGQPFYNSNAPFLFSDSFPEALRRSDPSRPLEEIESTWRAARRYWDDHSIGEIAGRAVRGVAVETFILLRALGPSPLNESRALIGGVVLLLALLDMGARRERHALLLVYWVGVFVMLFGWYVPIAAGDRFVVPLVPLIYVHAASMIVRLNRVAFETDGRSPDQKLLIISIVWCVFWTGWTLLSPSLSARLAG